MENTRLTGTDIITTRLGFGCARLMREGSSKTRERILAAAHEAGIRHFDVARMYGLGAAEGELGKFMRGKREQLVIATKFGIDLSPAAKRAAGLQSVARRMLAAFPALRRLVRRGGGALVQPRDFSAAKARSSLETSLRELGTDYIDILFLHEPRPADLSGSDVFDFLQEAQDDGLIRAYGISGGFGECLDICRRFPRLAPVVQFPNDIIQANTERHEIGGERALLTYSPLSGVLQPVIDHLDSNRGNRNRWSRLTGIDCTANDNIAALLLRYCLDVVPDGTVLFSSSRPERIRSLSEKAFTFAARAGDLSAFRRLVRKEVFHTAPEPRYP